MEVFKAYLNKEFVKRQKNNSRYSLRAFANHLDLHHATLSSMMSGKRKITTATIRKLSKPLNLSPKSLSLFCELEQKQHLQDKQYFILQEELFNIVSEWYFDAILEFSRITQFKMEPSVLAKSLGLPRLTVKLALDTLQRLDLLREDSGGRLKLTYKNSTNLLNEEFTSSAHRSYQKSLLTKSLDAIDSIDRNLRDHTSLTTAICRDDLPKARKLIKKFRKDLDKLLQKPEAQLNEVYQLQVSFFPVSHNYLNKKEVQ